MYYEFVLINVKLSKTSWRCRLTDKSIKFLEVCFLQN